MTTRNDTSDVIDAFMPLAQLYKQDFLGRHMILEFNNSALDIYWQKRHFMHLCGLDCTVPQRMYKTMGHVVKSEMFFDALIAGNAKKLLPRHSHNAGITRDKLRVLPLLLDSPSSIESIVDSASHNYDYFFGSELWCAGVTASQDQAVDPDTGVYAPRTLRNISIMSRSIKAIQSPSYPLKGWRILPPRKRAQD